MGSNMLRARDMRDCEVRSRIRMIGDFSTSWSSWQMVPDGSGRESF